MKQHRITLLLERLYVLDQALGGNERGKNPQKSTKEFDQILYDLKDKIEMIAAQQNDRDAKIKKYGNDQDSISLGVQIRDSIIDCEKEIKQMEKALLRQLKKPKKYDPKETEQRVISFKLLKVAFKATKTKEFGYEEQEFKGVGLKELQGQVFENYGQQQQVNYDTELSKEEEEAMERWKLNDEHMDQQLDEIIAGIDQLNLKAVMIGEKIDQTQSQMNKLIVEVDKTQKQLNNANQALKKLTQVYRRPNKFVLDVMFVLLLLGLIATIVTTFTKK